MDDSQTLTSADAEQVFDRMVHHPDYRMYVAIRDDRIVGTFALLIMDKLAHRGAPAGVIEDVAVDPQWQGLGIGTAIMRHALRLCGEKGCYKANDHPL